MIELLAPAGGMDRLNTAFHFGADAVYLGGKNFSLRSYARNFEQEEILQAVKYAHGINKKVYVTLNIFPKTSDFDAIKEYLQFLKDACVDGVIVSDIGVLELALKYGIPVHISTQANTTNAYAAKVYREMGAQRLILARELSVDDIKSIKDKTNIELEVFVHGAMCVSISGRCLLSNYLSDRDSNRGECVQACRWEYTVKERARGKELTVREDERGTYIFNSKDLCMLLHLKLLKEAGVDAFKIEGRMKTSYYVANVVNAYRRVMDNGYNVTDELVKELDKCSHRGYTTGFYLDETDREETSTSKTYGTHEFVAEVIENGDGGIWVEQRNRFYTGDTLEILSPGENFNKTITIDRMYDIYGNIVDDAKLVQQKLFIPAECGLSRYDILRKKIKE